MQRRHHASIRIPKIARSRHESRDRHGFKQRIPDWHNLFNTFLARWGHRRRRRDAALSVGVTAGLRRGSAHVAACRRQFGCRGNSIPAAMDISGELSRATRRYKSLEIIMADGRLIVGHITDARTREAHSAREYVITASRQVDQLLWKRYVPVAIGRSVKSSITALIRRYVDPDERAGVRTDRT